MNILLVDDEQLLLEELEDAVAEVVPSAGLHSFSKASEALEYARAHRVDVAMLDINMRIINGVAMARELQKMYPRVNIIFCTGYTEYAMDALDLNCSGYLLKPVTREKIVRAMSNLRYPAKSEKSLEIRCFGGFEASANGTPLSFRRRKTKELLAFLVHQNGAGVSSREICAVLWDDDGAKDQKNLAYLWNLVTDLKQALTAVGAENVLERQNAEYALCTDMISCDYYEHLKGNYSPMAAGGYLPQYSWAEATNAALQSSHKSS